MKASWHLLKRRLSSRVKFPVIWRELRNTIVRLYRKTASNRRSLSSQDRLDNLQKQAVAVLQDLQEKNMSAMAGRQAGTEPVSIHQPGTVIAGCADKSDRGTQAMFHCVRCGLEASADHMPH
ncbi:MAG: hypothetical protein Q4F72_07195 [Desulfovibrionaceae bacterium]|nr:hypothetical protein [Desulfovibrionaceae bacterium]